MSIAAIVLSWVVVLACLYLARLTMQTHRAHIVPGLALIALLLGIEAVELGALAWMGGGAATVAAVRLLTLLRYGALLGFWMGVRFSSCPLDSIGGVRDVWSFTASGWACFARHVLDLSSSDAQKL